MTIEKESLQSISETEKPVNVKMIKEKVVLPKKQDEGIELPENEYERQERLLEQKAGEIQRDLQHWVADGGILNKGESIKIAIAIQSESKVIPEDVEVFLSMKISDFFTPERCAPFFNNVNRNKILSTLEHLENFYDKTILDLVRLRKGGIMKIRHIGISQFNNIEQLFNSVGIEIEK